MSVAVVQHAHAYGNGSMPSFVLGTTPTVGNLVVLFYVGGDTGVASNSVINGWTRQLHNFSGSQTVVVFSRYVVGGDTTTYGPPVSSTGSDNGLVGYEVSGAAATWASALDQSELVVGGAAATTTSVTALTTTSASQLALVAYGYAGGFLAAAPTLSGASFTQDESQSNAFGPIGAGSKQIASAGTTGSPTIAWNATSTASNYVMVTLRGGASGETAAISTILTGVSQHFVATVGPAESATITTQLAGVSQHFIVVAPQEFVTIGTHLQGVSQVFHVLSPQEFATITTTLSGVSQHFTVDDLTAIGTVRQFWTFGG